MSFFKTGVIGDEGLIDAKLEYEKGKDQEIAALRKLVYDGHTFMDEQLLRLEARRATIMTEIEHRDRGQGARHWVRLMGRLDAVNEAMESVKGGIKAAGRDKPKTRLGDRPEAAVWGKVRELEEHIAKLEEVARELANLAEKTVARVDALENKIQT